MDQGVINSLKCSCKATFIRKCLEFSNSGNGKVDFQKNNLQSKGALWSTASSWNAFIKDILIQAWHNIWPASIFLDVEDENNEFHGFCIYKNKTIQELFEYAKNVSSEIAVDEEIIKTSLNAGKNAPNVL